MKALSIMQPWAWLITHPVEIAAAGIMPKLVENRNWPTRFRGQVLVHAGKGFDRDGYEWVRETFPGLEMPGLDAFERGGIVGQMRIADCVEDSRSPWFFGPYAFVVDYGMQLPFRPCKGALGFFTPQFEAAEPAKGVLL